MKYRVKLSEGALVVTVKYAADEQLYERELSELSRGVPGLFRASKGRGRQIKYTAPKSIPLHQRLRMSVSRYDFFFIIAQITGIKRTLKANKQLSFSRLVLDKDRIYINLNTCELSFLYLPFSSRNGETDMMAFLEDLVYSVGDSDGAEARYLSEFSFFLRSLGSFDADRIDSYISKLEPKVIDTLRRRRPNSGFLTDDPGKHGGRLGDDPGGTIPMVGGTAPLEIGGTIPLDDPSDPQTTVLNEQGKHWPTLVCKSGGEEISVSKPVFRLGKEASYVDYFIKNNTYVSRSHADIITRGDRVYIMDLNSLNGTFIDGSRIPPQQEIELSDGAKLTLANEEFIFRA